MKRHSLILAGTALGLLMASAPLGAFPLEGNPDHQAPDHQAMPAAPALPLILAQADCPEGESAEACAAGQAPAEQAAPTKEERKQRRKKQREAEEPASEQQAAPQAQPEQRDAAPAEEAAPAEQREQKPRRKKQKEPSAEQQAAPEAQPEQNAAPAEKAAPAAEQEQKPRRKKQKEAAEPASPAAEPEQPSGDEAGEPGSKKDGSKKDKLRDYLNKKKQGGTQEEPAEARPAPAEDAAPTPEEKPAEKAVPSPEQKPAEAAPTPQQGEQGEQAGEPGSQKDGSKKDKLRDYLNKKKQGGEAAPAEAAPTDEATQPAGEGQAEGAAEQTPEQAAQPELPADTREQAMPKPRGEGKPLPENAAPLPDSAKNGRAAGASEEAGRNRTERPRAGEGKPEALPRSDSAAQTEIGKIGRIDSVEAVEGKRLDRQQWREERNRQRRERHDRDGGQIVKEVDNRVIVRFGDNIYVDNRDSNARLERHARDSYVEELPNRFTRYTIVKEDGTRVVTIRDADGNIVRRSRILPNRREVVLYYVPESDYGRIRGGYRDAGADLPPLRLDIPADEYILDAQYAQPDDYYTYLDAPPVEPVERIYSVDEVVHSARIRDKVRRIDLDTITFDTGSAEIGEDQVNRLEALGDAINRILEQNPAETFLIEGHTDAVGSDESNLVLSDERAQSVAEALTSVFDIPAENLTTQGYGERYLKVDTQSASRDNRRVAVRRITPLVAPVARAE